METKCFNNKMQNKIILITIGTYPTNQVANAKNELMHSQIQKNSIK